MLYRRTVTFFPRIYLFNKIVLFLRILLGSIFVYSGLFKVFNPAVFEQALTGYGIIPDNLIKVVSIIFPWIEITIGILLIFKLFLRITTIITVALLLAFVLITIISVFKGTVGGCGCFSESFILNFRDPIKIVVRNILLVMIAILVFFRYKIDLNKAIRNKYNVIKYAYAFLLLISLSTLFVLMGREVLRISYIECI